MFYSRLNMISVKFYKLLALLIMTFVVCIPVSVSLSIESNQPTLTVTLSKIHYVDLVVEKINVDASSDSIGFPTSLEEGDEVMITLTRIKEYPGEQDFNQFIDYKFEDTESTIQLIPGTYLMDSQYMVNREVIIPGREDTYCKGYGSDSWKQTGSDFTTTAAGVVVGAAVAEAIAAGGISAGLSAATGVFTSLGSVGGAGLLGALGIPGLVVLGAIALVAVVSLFDDCIGTEEKISIPEVNMNPAILGGAIGNITISDNLYSKDKLTFYVFSSEPPLVIEELNILASIEELSSNYPEMIQPD